jgi:hypothetical protein
MPMTPNFFVLSLREVLRLSDKIMGEKFCAVFFTVALTDFEILTPNRGNFPIKGMFKKI